MVLFQTRFTDELRGAFLLALARLGEVPAAAASVGVSKRTAYRHMAEDPDFKEACQIAVGRLTEELLTIARQIAIEGVVVEITTDPKTGKVTEKRKHDARLLEKWLKRFLPEWKDTVKVDHEVSGAIEHKGRIDVANLSTEQKRLVRRLLVEDVGRN